MNTSISFIEIIIAQFIETSIIGGESSNTPFLKLRASGLILPLEHLG